MTDNLPTPQRIFLNQQRDGVQPTNVADVAPVVPAKRPPKRCRPPPNGCGGLLAGPSGSELGCTCCSCPGCNKCTKIGTKQHTRCGEDRIGRCPEGTFVYQRCEGCNATQQALKRAKSKGNQQRLKELDMHSAAVAVEIPAQDEETAASAILALAPPASSLPAGHSAALASAMWTQLQERDHVDGAASAPAPGDAAAAVSAAEAASAASAAAISAAAATASTTITLASVPPAHSAPEPLSAAPVCAAAQPSGGNCSTYGRRITHPPTKMGMVRTLDGLEKSMSQNVLVLGGALNGLRCAHTTAALTHPRPLSRDSHIASCASLASHHARFTRPQ